RVGLTQHFDRAIGLADEVPDDLDAVAPEVDDGPTAGARAVPEPCRVRSPMGFPGADPRDVADHTGPYRREGLAGLRRVAEVLEVAGEDPRLLDHVEHAPGFVGRASQRLGTQDGLAGRRGQRHGFFVAIV